MEPDSTRERAHLHRRAWRHAHRDWRVWIVVVLMIGLMLVYVLTDNLSIRPGERAVEPTPAANLP